MPFAIYILALATFAVGTQSYVFVGVLSDLANQLNVSLPVAGQLATAFAVTSGLAGPFVVNAITKIEKRKALLFALGSVAMINLITALLPNFSLLMFARILAALCAISVIPIAGSIAVSMVRDDMQGRALGAILSGLTLALILGVPIGTYIGNAFDWRATFLFAGIMALVVIPIVARYVPVTFSEGKSDVRNLRIAFIPKVAYLLVLSLMSFIASYPIFAYIAPFIEIVTGQKGNTIALLQAMIGVGSIIGLYVGGRMADFRALSFNLKCLFGGFVFIQLAYSSFFFFSNALGTFTFVMPLGILIMLSSSVLFALGPVIEKALVNEQPQHAALTLSMNTSMIYIGQGIGAALGGSIIAVSGYFFIGIVCSVIATVSCLIIFRFKKEEKVLDDASIQP